MRHFLLIFFSVLLLNVASGQAVKPEIVGQKELQTDQGQPITVRLSDLFVKETQDEQNGENDDSDLPGGDENGDSDKDGGGDDGDSDNDHSEGDDDDQNNDHDEDSDQVDDGEDDNDDNDHQGDDQDDGDGDNGNDGASGEDDDDGGEENGHGNNGNGANGGDKEDEGKGKEKDKDKDKDKDKEKDKGKDKDRNDRTAAYPAGYALEISSGQHYTVSGTTITPEPTFTGVLRVAVSVRNASHSSPKYPLKITVIPQSKPSDNQAPVVTGQVPLNSTMNTPLKVEFAHLLVSDPDDQYPEGFSVELLPGEEYQVNETTVTPANGFVGVLSVPVVVNDGKADSEAFALKITVIAETAGNVAPTITGQIPLSISANQTINIVLSHLSVVDPDNAYPEEFTLKVHPGDHYTVNGVTVRPDQGFYGVLSVGVSVHDGKTESNVYPLTITVASGQNQKPVITGQEGIKLPERQSLQIRLSHLVVEDPDNRYPDDFSLRIGEGDHYTVSTNNTITAHEGFLGALTIPVTVHDGKASSDPFGLRVEIIARDRLEITGQELLEVLEDSVMVITLTDLSVNDPSNEYPQGFTLQIFSGENYEVGNGNRIAPHSNFAGNLTVPVAITGDGITSEPFSLLVIVLPVNDPPELMNLPAEPLAISGPGTWVIAPGITVADVDDDHLLFAEVGFDSATYAAGAEYLAFEPSDSIHGVFDAEAGILFLVGRAGKEEYENIIRSVRYSLNSAGDSVLLTGTRKVYITLNDGKETSAIYERVLSLENDIALEIPTAFTPNNDTANDTWRITPLKQADEFNTHIRVYDKRGNVVFESQGLNHEWDGHYNGDPLPADVYFYTIEMDYAYRKVNYKGIVSILR